MVSTLRQKEMSFLKARKSNTVCSICRVRTQRQMTLARHAVNPSFQRFKSIGIDWNRLETPGNALKHTTPIPNLQPPNPKAIRLQQQAPVRLWRRRSNRGFSPGCGIESEAMAHPGASGDQEQDRRCGPHHLPRLDAHHATYRPPAGDPALLPLVDAWARARDVCGGGRSERTQEQDGAGGEEVTGGTYRDGHSDSEEDRVGVQEHRLDQILSPSSTPSTTARAANTPILAFSPAADAGGLER